MFVHRITTQFSRTVLTQCRNSLLHCARQQQQLQPHVPIFSNQLHSLSDLQSKVVADQVSLLHNSIINALASQRFGFSSTASPEPSEKDTAQEHRSAAESDVAAAKLSEDAEASASSGEVLHEEDVEDLSRDDLVKLVSEKEELLKTKNEELKQMQDKVLRAYAEMENVMDRTKREAENSKKFAIQNFAKSLLDVADNMGRAASVVKDSFSKIDASKDTVGAVPLLKTLLEGVEMTDKQLAEVFKKFGLEKFDPTNEQFDPHRHNAMFQVPDPAKPAGTVAVVLKSGYMLHDRIIRPAEVGVTVAVDNNGAEQGSKA